MIRCSCGNQLAYDTDICTVCLPNGLPTIWKAQSYCKRCGKTRTQHYGNARCYQDEDVQFIADNNPIR